MTNERDSFHDLKPSRHKMAFQLLSTVIKYVVIKMSDQSEDDGL